MIRVPFSLWTLPGPKARKFFTYKRFRPLLSAYSGHVAVQIYMSALNECLGTFVLFLIR
jgi:hypothetical protein